MDWAQRAGPPSGTGGTRPRSERQGLATQQASTASAAEATKEVIFDEAVKEAIFDGAGTAMLGDSYHGHNMVSQRGGRRGSRSGTDRRAGGVSGGRSSRRAVLQSTAAVVAAGAGLSVVGTTAADEEYEETVDIVEDFGADPTGEEPIDDALDEAVYSHTKVVFPEGRYLVSETFERTVFDAALVGDGDDPEDVTITPPEGSQQVVLFLSGTGIRIENVAFDESTEDTVTGIITRCDDDLVLRDLRFLGPAGGPGVAEEVDAPADVAVHGPFDILPGVRDPDGTGLIENVRAPDGCVEFYRKGGVFVDNGNSSSARHAGHLLFRGCEFSHFSDNAIYGSAPGISGPNRGGGGSIGVENCLFRNNNTSAIRLGTPGSYAKNCTVISEAGEVPTLPWGGLTSRAGWVWYEFDGFYENIEVIHDHPRGFGILDHDDSTRNLSLSVRDCRFEINNEGPVIRMADPGIAEVALDNVAITGEAGPGSAIELYNTSFEIEDLCLSQSGENRNGIEIGDETMGSITNAIIDVSGDALFYGPEANLTVTNLSEASHDCPSPDPDHDFDGEPETWSAVPGDLDGESFSQNTTPTPSPTPTATPEPTPTATSSPTPTPTETPEESPGFGALAALGGLGAAGWAVLRRHNREDAN